MVSITTRQASTATPKKILNRTINDAQTDKAKAYYYLGQVAVAQKNNAEAKANFDKGIQADPDCPYNYVGLGALELRNGNKKAAEDNSSRPSSW